jgi:hypothetical protein
MIEETIRINNLARHKYVGRLIIGGEYGILISLEKKPNVVHRFFMRVLLGFKWKDKQ